MAFQKGQSGNPAGRKPGAQNKLTLTVKQGFEVAFEQLQKGDNALELWAEKNPTEFYRLASKLIPAQIAATVEDVTELPPVERAARLAAITARLAARGEKPDAEPEDGSDLA